MPESDTRVSEAAQKRAALVLIKNPDQDKVSRAARSKSPNLKGLESQRQPVSSRKRSASVPATSPVTKITRRASVWRRGRHRAVELHAVDARHLEIADDQVVMGFGEAGQSLLTVAGTIDAEPRIPQRFRHGDRERRLVFHHQHPQALERVKRDRLLRRSIGAGRQLLTR